MVDYENFSRTFRLFHGLYFLVGVFKVFAMLYIVYRRLTGCLPGLVIGEPVDGRLHLHGCDTRWNRK